MVQGFVFKRDTIYLPKKIKVKYNNHRVLEGKVRSITFKQDMNKWNVSILCKIDDVLPVNIVNSVGIDLGITTFAVLSNGKVLESSNYYRKEENQLKELQRVISHKKNCKGKKKSEKIIK